MPGWLSMPFNHERIDSDQIIRDERDLLNRHAQHIRGMVTRIDANNRELRVHYIWTKIRQYDNQRVESRLTDHYITA